MGKHNMDFAYNPDDDSWYALMEGVEHIHQGQLEATGRQVQVYTIKDLALTLQTAYRWEDAGMYTPSVEMNIGDTTEPVLDQLPDPGLFPDPELPAPPLYGDADTVTDAVNELTHGQWHAVGDQLGCGTRPVANGCTGTSVPHRPRV